MVTTDCLYCFETGHLSREPGAGSEGNDMVLDFGSQRVLSHACFVVAHFIPQMPNMSAINIAASILTDAAFS